MIFDLQFLQQPHTAGVSQKAGTDLKGFNGTLAASAWNRVRWGCLWRKPLGSRATKPLKAALGLAEAARKAEAGADGKMNE